MKDTTFTVISDKPSKPLNLRPKAYSKDFITIEWDVPESDGGSPITGYKIEKRDAKRDNYIKVGETEADKLEIKSTKLVEGNQYHFRVYAVNEIGESEPGITDEPITAKLPFDPPGPPINLIVSDITKATANLAWEVPEFDGGSPVTGYYIERNIATRWVKVNKKATTKLTRELKDLVEEEAYEYRALAENLAGVGEPSESVTFVAKDPFSVPGQPGQPEVEEVTAEGVKLSWSEPESDGGAEIITYIVEGKKKGVTKWQRMNKDHVTETEFKVKDVQPDVDYEFRVSAENKAGVGKASLPCAARYSECGLQKYCQGSK